MAPLLGQSIVVENVGGAGGSIGMQRLARAPADGYTIGFGTVGTHAANMIIYREPAYDAQADFAPLGLVGEAPVVLLANPTLSAKDFDQFIAEVRTNQKTLSYGSAGVGSISHLACLLLLADLGVDVMHVPYRGVAPAMTGLMGGETDFMCDQTTTALPQIRSGRVRALSDPELVQQMRAVGVTFPSAQANTPQALTERIASEIARLRPILESKHVKVD